MTTRTPDTASDETLASEAPQFPVAVIIERRPATSPWIDHTWRAAGIVVGRHSDQDPSRLLRQDGDRACFLVGGLEVALHVDECESYYHNLVSDTPRAYVVARLSEDDARPLPFLVSMSFDEAHAYLEGDDEIYAVDIPGELYRWTEAYVIAHYFPEKKKKRKLRDWKTDDSGTGPGARRR
jgi:hypothetical protein